MGKRSKYERHDRDFYATPPEAVDALLPYIEHVKIYDEPCAGDGALMIALGRANKKIIFAGDIEPQSVGIAQRNALEIERCGGDAFITNPPWQRDILHDLIGHLSAIAPTYFLMDAGWAHTKQAIPYMDYCQAIISVGRLKWISDSPSAGMEDTAWYLFDQSHAGTGTQFFARRND